MVMRSRHYIFVLHFDELIKISSSHFWRVINFRGCFHYMRVGLPEWNFLFYYSFCLGVIPLDSLIRRF